MAVSGGCARLEGNLIWFQQYGRLEALTPDSRLILAWLFAHHYGLIRNFKGLSSPPLDNPEVEYQQRIFVSSLYQLEG